MILRYFMRFPCIRSLSLWYSQAPPRCKRAMELDRLKQATSQPFPAYFLHGPPGCGKSTLIQSYHNATPEIPKAIFDVSNRTGHDFVSMLYGMYDTILRTFKQVALDCNKSYNSKIKVISHHISSVIEDTQIPILTKLDQLLGLLEQKQSLEGAGSGFWIVMDHVVHTEPYKIRYQNYSRVFWQKGLLGLIREPARLYNLNREFAEFIQYLISGKRKGCKLVLVSRGKYYDSVLKALGIPADKTKPINLSFADMDTVKQFMEEGGVPVEIQQYLADTFDGDLRRYATHWKTIATSNPEKIREVIEREIEYTGKRLSPFAVSGITEGGRRVLEEIYKELAKKGAAKYEELIKSYSEDAVKKILETEVVSVIQGECISSKEGDYSKKMVVPNSPVDLLVMKRYYNQLYEVSF
eukprot:TRINITY_DN87952_c0_g1_i1.p1 TRINITY_DN87952_c0_g1~~TRINITY_DN87952_c0_g1_i1.p1  ORF type:complete len:450 (+),score=29.16 TRINITY_DN87952_c0_g1_i1:122-1351(+)